MKKHIWKIVIVGLIGICIFYLFSLYQDFMSVPAARLAPGEEYPEMPSDSHHRYIDLPLDHKNPELGTFRGFYILSPSFNSGTIIFQLFDNQQEMVWPFSNEGGFEPFDERVGTGASYVLIGNRWVSPTLFPEVFPNGKIDYSLALNLYGSHQQVEDIELIRKDMIKNWLITPESVIILYGRSGGGVLVQEYVDKYGQYIDRILLESTWAPDLAIKNNQTFARNLWETNEKAAQSYRRIYQEKGNNPYLSWTAFKLWLEGNYNKQKEVLESGFFSFLQRIRYFFNLPKNFFLIKFIFKSPTETEVKVRMWELLGNDLIKYKPLSSKEINLMYDRALIVLGDFIQQYHKGIINNSSFNFDRKNFTGEVLILTNKGDQDFWEPIAIKIKDQYPNSHLIVFEGLSHKIEMNEKLIKIISCYIREGLSCF